VEKMINYIKHHHKQLDSMTLQKKLEMLSKLGAVIEKLPLISPMASYKVTDRFRMRAASLLKKKRMHSGIDLAGKKSCDIFASASGIVIYAGRKNGYGSIIIIDHGRGISTYYAHLRSVGVRKGRRVLFGERIGIQGNTGNSSGDHLHYETRLNNQPVNPEIMHRFRNS